MSGLFLKQNTPNTKEEGNTTDKSVTGMESTFRRTRNLLNEKLGEKSYEQII